MKNKLINSINNHFNYKAALFDLDGVIVDTVKYHYMAWKKIAAELGFEFTEAHNERLKGISRMQSLERLLEVGNISLGKAAKAALCEKKNKLYISYIVEINEKEILPGAKDCLLKMRAKGIKVALGSASKNADIILKNLRITKLFDTVVDGNIVEKAKPDPEVFLTGAKILGVNPGECIVFEDSEAGIIAAKAAGMYAVGIGSETVLKDADMVVQGLGNFDAWFLFNIMNGRERTKLAMENKIPDRVPVMCQLSFGHILLNTAIRPSDFVYNPQYFAEGLWETMKQYKFDGVMINQYFNISEDDRNSLRIEKRQDGDMCYFPNGDVVLCPNDDPPRYYHQQKFPEIEDVNLSEIRVDVEIPDWKTEAHRIIIKKAEGKYSVHGEVISPMDSIIEVLGVQNSLMGLVTEPGKVKELMEMNIQKILAYAKAQIEVGVDAMKISSPYVGSGFISKEHYMEFVLPFEKMLVSLIHAFKPDIPIYTHTCGKINDRLELMAETGIDGLECLDPKPIGDCDLSDAKARIGNKLFIKGNMDSVNVLLKATPESIERYVKKQIKDGANNGGYILSTACSVAPWVSPEIMKMLVPLAEKYGQY